MKNALVFIGAALAIVMFCGCSSTDTSNSSAGTSSEATAPAGKPGMDNQAKGVGADQVGLAPGAQNPDAQTGSKVGGGQ